MSIINNISKPVATLAFTALLPTSVWAQTNITGRVTDAVTGDPLIGAIISVKGQKTAGAITNTDGEFTVHSAKNTPVSIVVSYVGYRSQQIDVYDAEDEISVALREASDYLKEVVVIGYGTQNRTQLTGAVSTIKSDVFTNTTSATLDGALGGQVAGLHVTASSGQPGSESRVRIRGGNSVNASNEPLYVVDGFIYFKDAANNGTGLGAIESGLNPLATINPNDIESVEVLKDVSATAIYGSRGANGVIIITTKKGKAGQKKANISYGYSLGISNVSRKLDLMNASQWAQYQKTYWGNKGGYTDEQIAALGKGTDWQDAVLRTGLQQNHELSIIGASDKSRYAFSVNYTDQDGIVINSGFQRYNFHVNADWDLKKNLKFGINVTYGRSKQQGLTTTEEQRFNSSPFSAGITNSFVYALLTPPVVNIYNADGSYNFKNPYEYAYFAIGDHAANAVYDLKESVAENINNYLLSNIWATYQLGDFKLKASLGLSSEKLTQNYFSGAYTSLGLATKGIGGVGNRQTDIWQQEYTVNYLKQVADIHQIEVLAGYSRQQSISTHSSIRTNHFTNESLKQYNLSDGAEIYTPQNGISESKLNSLITRVNYTLLDRYNATATFRADHSSRFAKNHRWGYFPSLGLSWNLDKEPIFNSVKQLDYLKLRASGGLVGNQEISDYAFATSYVTGSYGGSSNYSKGNAVNENLKWETTASYNIGVDAGFFGGRINLIVDAYYKKTSDLLLNVPVGFSQGVSSQLQNVGNVVNKGIELAVNGTLVSNKKLNWTVNANIAHNKNEITSTGGAQDIILGTQNQQIIRKGEPLGAFYGLEFAGIVQQGEDVSLLPTINGIVPQPGDAKFVDVNHDNVISSADRKVLGSTQPSLTYGLSSQLQFGAFDASVSFAGSYGNKLYNALGRRLEQTGDSYNVLTTVLDSWTAENGNNVLPKASTSRPFSYIDSRYVQNASYLKLKNLTICYRLPIPKQLDFGVRLYVTATNLLTITPYKGYDPEVSSGTDTGAYPSARTFTFGVNLTL
jgi:TonB-linked SusC/RagA family outer membrane protein